LDLDEQLEIDLTIVESPKYGFTLVGFSGDKPNPIYLELTEFGNSLYDPTSYIPSQI